MEKTSFNKNDFLIRVKWDEDIENLFPELEELDVPQLIDLGENLFKEITKLFDQNSKTQNKRYQVLLSKCCILLLSKDFDLAKMYDKKYKGRLTEWEKLNKVTTTEEKKDMAINFEYKNGTIRKITPNYIMIDSLIRLHREKHRISETQNKQKDFLQEIL